MIVVKENCGACPQDIVVEFSVGSIGTQRFNFYFRHGVARLYAEDETTLLTSREYVGKADPMADGILPLDEVEDLVLDMVRSLYA